MGRLRTAGSIEYARKGAVVFGVLALLCTPLFGFGGALTFAVGLFGLFYVVLLAGEPVSLSVNPAPIVLLPVGVLDGFCTCPKCGHMSRHLIERIAGGAGRIDGTVRRCVHPKCRHEWFTSDSTQATQTAWELGQASEPEPFESASAHEPAHRADCPCTNCWWTDLEGY